MTKSTDEATTKDQTDPQTDDIIEQYKALQAKNKPFQKYLAMLVSTGTITEGQDLDATQMQSIIVDFNTWKEAGSPEIKMPEVESVVKIPSLLIRWKHLGKQYLVKRFTDGSEEGIKVKTIYGKIRNPQTGEETENTNQVLDRIEEPTTLYTRKAGIAAVKHITDLNVQPQFIFRHQGHNFSVNEKDFNAPGDGDDREFEDIIEEHSARKYQL